MQITHKRDFRTCSECEQTKQEGYVIRAGAFVFCLCEDCFLRFGNATRRKIRKIRKRKAANNHDD